MLNLDFYFSHTLITLIFLFYWNVLYRICLRLMVKHNTLLNWALEILLFPAVIILRVFLSLLDSLYKVLLHIKPQSYSHWYNTSGIKYQCEFGWKLSLWRGKLQGGGS